VKEAVTLGGLTMHVRNFQGALSYQNPTMLARFVKRNGGTTEEAQELFEATKQFLLVVITMDRPVSPTKRIDEMWHHFILHTHDYASWCEEFVGCFVHHYPSEDAASVSRTEVRNVAMQLFPNLNLAFWPTTVATLGDCDGGCTCSFECAQKIGHDLPAGEQVSPAN